jgi:tetratricopeptide (TPR) repeat protein
MTQKIDITPETITARLKFRTPQALNSMSLLTHRKLIRGALFLFAVALGTTSSLRAAENDPIISTNPFVTEGYAQLEAGHSDIALEAFQKALETNTDNLSAQLGQAMIFAQQQRHQDAFTSFDAIVQRFPRHAFAWNGRGMAAFNLADFDEALTSFEMATADQPVNGFFYESLAWTRMCRGEFAQAAESAKYATLMYNRKGETTSYPLLIAYFSYLETGDLSNAERTLFYAVKNTLAHQWPAPVIQYLSSQITLKALISHVSNTSEETEAHTYIGLSLRSKGDEKTSIEHLNWVRQHGDSRVFEYTLARSLSLQNSVAALVH